MRVIAIIPARLNSKRFPKKLLEKINGTPLILMTYQNLISMNIFDEIIVATDSVEISNTIKKNGGKVFISKKKHLCGSDRVSEASRNYKSDIVINVQGDEPFVKSKSLKKIISFFSDNLNRNIPVVSLFYKTNNPEIVNNENSVKVVVNKNNFALYFSRSKIPFLRNKNKNFNFNIHVGVYGFLYQSIINFSGLKPSKLEKIEMLECIRFIENSQKIKMFQIEEPTIGIDTSEDLNRAKKYLEDIHNV
ncbi:3-deoxy-manno-octulosonate cytidylyltransferase [bacterium]|nr:3-deoxy-manno-octulosonate cytidylyltransferase [bacterium]